MTGRARGSRPSPNVCTADSRTSSRRSPTASAPPPRRVRSPAGPSRRQAPLRQVAGADGRLHDLRMQPGRHGAATHAWDAEAMPQEMPTSRGSSERTAETAPIGIAPPTRSARPRSRRATPRPHGRGTLRAGLRDPNPLAAPLGPGTQRARIACRGAGVAPRINRIAEPAAWAVAGFELERGVGPMRGARPRRRRRRLRPGLDVAHPHRAGGGLRNGVERSQVGSRSTVAAPGLSSMSDSLSVRSGCPPDNGQAALAESHRAAG